MCRVTERINTILLKIDYIIWHFEASKRVLRFMFQAIREVSSIAATPELTWLLKTLSLKGPMVRYF